jgi:hypothetical protein
VRQLPPFAARKLAQLRQQADDCTALQQTAVATAGQCRNEVFALSQAETSDQQLVQAAQDRLTEAERTVEARMRVASSIRQNLAQISTWLSKLPRGQALQDVHLAPAKPRKRLTIAETVDVVREELHAAQTELYRISTAAPSAEELKQKVAALVAELGARGKPALSVRAGKLTVNWRPDQSWDRSGNALAHLEFAAWLNPQSIIDRLNQDIEGLQLDHTGALPPDEKAQRIADLEDEIDSLERTEESLICQAAAQQLTILRRPKASPAAVLGVRVVKRKAAAKAA